MVSFPFSEPPELAPRTSLHNPKARNLTVSVLPELGLHLPVFHELVQLFDVAGLDVKLVTELLDVLG